jgi:uncharacterized protein YndB with AHSA1/START domain
MASESRHVDATPERVWAQLADGWIYPVWVVGAAHIRDVDPRWPAPGTKLRHKVGAWPFSVSDETEVVESVAAARLVLRAKAWPLGEAKVIIELTAKDGGTFVEMREEPISGPGRWINNPLQELGLKLRNRESLARLATLAERRPPPP